MLLPKNKLNKLIKVQFETAKTLFKNKNEDLKKAKYR